MTYQFITRLKLLTSYQIANDLSIYNALKAPNQLSEADTERVQSAINQLGAVGGSGAPQATGCYYDNDADGKLSVGDQVEALLFNDGSGAPTPDGSYKVAKKTVDEAFLALYNPQNTSDSLSLSAEQIANINSGDNFEYINFDPATDTATDVNHDGKLSAGDTISGSYIHNPADGIVTNWTHTLTEGEASAINGDYGKAFDPVTSRPLEIQLTESLGLKIPDYVKAIFDKDGSSDLSSGDIALVSQIHIFEAPGELAPFFPSGPYISLTDEDIAKLDNNQNTSGSLSLSSAQIANINSGYSFEDVNFNPATDQAIDINKDGKLSAGDILSGLISNSNGDAVENWTRTLTNEDANVINGGYGDVLVSKTEPNLENVLLRERLGEVLGLPIFEGNSVKTIFDKDNNGELSAGDIALVTQGRNFAQGVADGQISTEPTPYFPDNYIALTANEVKQVNAGTISIPDSQKTSLEKLFSLTNSSLVDSDNNGALSKGDVLAGLSAYGTSDRKVLTDEMASQALGKYGAELALSSQETQAMSDALDLKAKSIFGDWFAKSVVVQVFDTDSSGDISTGDTLSLRPEFYTTPYAEQINYHQLNNEEIDKLKSAGLI